MLLGQSIITPTGPLSISGPERRSGRRGSSLCRDPGGQRFRTDSRPGGGPGAERSDAGSSRVGPGCSGL
jgi:hypothetical protein